jgi:hypothetical protein
LTLVKSEKLFQYRMKASLVSVEQIQRWDTHNILPPFPLSVLLTCNRSAHEGSWKYCRRLYYTRTNTQIIYYLGSRIGAYSHYLLVSFLLFLPLY